MTEPADTATTPEPGAGSTGLDDTDVDARADGGTTDGDETAGRVPGGMVALFVLLVSTVVATTAAMGMAAWLLPGANRDRMAEALRRCFVDNGVGEGTLAAQGDAAHRAEACLAPVQLAQASWALYGIALLAVVALAVHAAYPWWLIRRGGFTPLRESGELAGCLEALRRTVGLRNPPTYLLGSRTGTVDAVTFGGFRRRYVALDAGLVRAFAVDRSRFRAVVLHEMAHARGQDVHITYLTKSVWWAFVVVVWVPSVVVLATRWSDSGLPVLGALLALTAVVLVTRNTILRQRELHADSVAARHESGVDSVLAGLDGSAGRLRAWFSHHPHPAWRRRVAADPGLVRRPRWWEMGVVGLAAAIISTNLFYVVAVSLTSLPVTNVFLAGAAVAAGLVVPLVITGWRLVARDPADRHLRSVLGHAAALALGYLLGQQVAVFALVRVASRAAVEPPDLVGALLLLVGVVVVGVWATAAARAVSAAFDRPPGWALPVLVVGGTAAFLPWFASLLASGGLDLLGTWWFAVDLTPYDVAVPDAPGWAGAAGRWLGLVYAPLFQVQQIPVTGLSLALLWFVPLVITRAGRPVPAAGRALRTGLLGAAAFTVAAVGLVLLAKVGLSATARGSDGFRVGMFSALVDLAALTQVGVAACVRTRGRPVLVPLAVLVSALVSTAVVLFGVEVFGAAVDLWGRGSTSWPAQSLVITTFQQVTVTGAVFAVPGVLLGALFRVRERAPRLSPGPLSTAGLVTTMGVLVALTAVGGARAAGYWVTSARAGVREVVGAECLVGIWAETDRRSTITLSEEVGPMLFTGPGTVQAFDADGTVSVQFAPVVSRDHGHVVVITHSGTVTARYRVEGDRIVYSDVVPGTTFSVAVDDQPGVITAPVTEFGVDTFSCRDNTLTQSGEGYSATLTRSTR